MSTVVPDAVVPEFSPGCRPVVGDLDVDVGAGSLICEVFAPTDMPVLQGHFPEAPIVPGVALVGWAVELARAHQLVEGRCAAIASAKFRRLVQPGTRLTARLKASARGGPLHFEYQSGGETVAVGRLLFEPDRD